MGWLDRWDKRNKAWADEMMRNPDAGMEDRGSAGLLPPAYPCP